jgi:predicted O-methyltransferase YrrM/glycosyltransferase involved in cell wall biosynthesis
MGSTETLHRPEFSADWFSHQVSHWSELLLPFRDKPAHFLEVGVFEGQSTLWLLENILTHPEARLTYIDTFEGEPDSDGPQGDDLAARFHSNTRPFHHKMTGFRGYSGEKLRQLPPASFDFVFIDGSHAAPDVLTDAVLCWPLLKEGGLLAFDDYEWDRFPVPERCPRLAIDAFLSVMRGQCVLVHKGYQVWIRKVGQAGAGDRPSICLMTTCMGRLDFLKQTLPAAVAQPDSVCVVVDYSCPERCGDWVEANFPTVQVVRVEGETRFCLSKARNAGLQAIRELWVCCYDCDIVLDPAFIRTVLPSLRPGYFYQADPLDDLGTWGTFIGYREDVERGGGYDEIYEGWGDEDVDFFSTLEFSGIQRGTFPASLIRHLPHGDDLRVKFHNNKDRWMNALVNKVFRNIKFDLMRQRGGLLSRSFREELYRTVSHMVHDSCRNNVGSELNVGQGMEGMPRDWILERGLKYIFRQR